MGEKTASTRSENRTRRVIIVIAAVVVAFVALVIVAQLVPQGPAASTTPRPTSSASAAPEAVAEHPIVRRIDGDPMAIGDVDAPVVLVMWTDMRCPFCAVFSRETEPTLVEEYVATGKVRIEVHTVGYFEQPSVDAAVAAAAAGDQGMYFEYLSAVYAEAPEGARAELPREELIAFAEKIGIPDLARFTADLDREDLKQYVVQDTATAQQLGVGSVPFFVVGDKALAGAQPVDVFREFLDAALAQT